MVSQAAKQQSLGGQNFAASFLKNSEETMDFRPESSPGPRFDLNAVLQLIQSSQSSGTEKASDGKKVVTGAVGKQAEEQIGEVQQRQDLFTALGSMIALSAFGGKTDEEAQKFFDAMFASQPAPAPKPAEAGLSEEDILKLIQEQIAASEPERDRFFWRRGQRDGRSGSSQDVGSGGGIGSPDTSDGNADEN